MIAKDEFLIQVEGFIYDGFYVEWNTTCKPGLVCVWEYPGPEASWEQADNNEYLSADLQPECATGEQVFDPDSRKR